MVTKPRVTIRAMRVFGENLSSRYCFEIVLVTYTHTKRIRSVVTYAEEAVALRAGRRFVENIAKAAQ